MLLSLSLFFSFVVSDLERESQLQTPTGTLERWTNPQDEREFGVRLTREDGTWFWLENPVAHAPRDLSKVIRRNTQNIWTGESSQLQEVILVRPDGTEKTLGYADRRFDKECSALTQVKTPTALESLAVPVLLRPVLCSEKNLPIAATKNFSVVGKNLMNWVHCTSPAAGIIPQFCIWNPDGDEGRVQLAATYFLNRIRSDLGFNRLHPLTAPLEVHSWASESNRSVYDAETRILSLGQGKFLDGLDGFVVVHEWSHSLIDDLNKGFYGYEARFIHEAVADYVAAQLFKSPCFAPYDAQEVLARRCIRNLANDRKYPTDMTGENAHEDSQILSGALWDLQKKISRGVVLEGLFETLMRVPKEAKATAFWTKLEDVFERLQGAGRISEERVNWVREIGVKRGLSSEILFSSRFETISVEP